MKVHKFHDAIFYPAVSENAGLLFSSVSGGVPSRSGFGFPLGFYWTGNTAGNYIENRFFGDICVIYFFGDTGRVTITVNGRNVITDTLVSTFQRVGAYRVVELTNLDVDYNVVRITVTATPVNVLGMLIHRINAPFLNLTSSSGFNITNALNSSFGLFSTTTPLGANGSITSQYFDLEQASRTINWILITVFANQNGTLHIEFSNDQTNADAVMTISYTANSTPYIEPIKRVARFVRVRYVNGTTAQTTFRLFMRGLSSTF
jgi:hypothetical protein